MAAPPRPSLKARAISLLAQREHSRSELRRKLLRLAHAEVRRTASAESDSPVEDATAVSSTVDTLLDWLEARGHLSHARFAESRIQARVSRHGAERIRLELARHGVAIEPAALRALKETELERATEIWRRKYGPTPASDAAGRARQARFLARRGFAPEVIYRVVKGLPDR